MIAHQKNQLPLSALETLGTRPIEVTSPEQFVPLFLAFAGHEPFFSFGLQNWYLYVADRFKVEVKNNKYLLGDGGTVATLAKEAIIRDAKESAKIYTGEIPKSYSFVINPNRTHTYMRENWVNMVTGESSELQSSLFRIEGGGGICAPFYFGMLSWEYYASLNNTLYPAHNMVWGAAHKTGVHSQLLVVVKAKYIPYLRACLFTKQPSNLPWDAMKLLRTSTLSNTSLGSDIIVKLTQGMLKRNEMLVEYKSYEEINAYLFPPMLSSTPEQALKYVQELIMTE